MIDENEKVSFTSSSITSFLVIICIQDLYVNLKHSVRMESDLDPCFLYICTTNRS